MIIPVLGIQTVRKKYASSAQNMENFGKHLMPI